MNEDGVLVDLDPEQIEGIAAAVAGGDDNVQDIYPLSPLQEGILFHHLLNEHDGTYILSGLFELRSHAQLLAWIAGLQKAIDRHDSLRTAIFWEGLPRAMQVVLRQAPLQVTELALEASHDPIEQLKQRMLSERQPFDLRQAPLLRLQIARDPSGTHWYALLQRHHIVFDHQSWNILFAEAIACMQGNEQRLQTPQSYRNYVAQVLTGDSVRDAEAFFRNKLADVTEPTAPFGLLDVSGDGSQLAEAHAALDPVLARRVRAQGRLLGVSAARLFHAAWALVVAHLSARDDIVCGTVLSGAQRGQQPMIGLFVSTLPLRVGLRDLTVLELTRRVDAELRELMVHRTVSAALAQRCSGVAGTSPLFTSVLNYRHSSGHSVVDATASAAAATGIRVVAQQYRTNYPLILIVDDLGESFLLTQQTDRRLDPRRIIGYVQTALHSMMEALERTPQRLALTLPILPEHERHQLLHQFNATRRPHSQAQLVHELFEQQVELSPQSIAVTCNERSLTYSELNTRANRVARYLRQRGIGPDRLVAIHVERSLEMVIGLLGILKAGGAYMPLDPNYPAERLQYMLEDAAPRIVLTQEKLREALPEVQADIVALDGLLPQLPAGAAPDAPVAALNSSHLVYVIYTSGSTGRPKGTAMEHHSMVNLIEWQRHALPSRAGVRVLQFAALSFDVAFQETFTTLCTGGTLVMLDEWVRRDARALAEFLREQAIERLFVPPLMLQSLAEYCRAAGATAPQSLRDVITAGEQLRTSPEISSFFRQIGGCRLHNHYGPTETHVVTALTLSGEPAEWPALPAIGQPIANTQIYVLDQRWQPAPIGVPGEIYIGGSGVARGYLQRPELTAHRFIVNPFGADSRDRLYRTGDLGRWHADGTLEYLGRNDDQVKIRGFRIELGEIELQLAKHERVKEAVVIAREDVPGEKRLVGYVTARSEVTPSAEDLRQHLQAILPEYMVPSAFVVLQILPTTPSGKLNRRALPAPDLSAFVSRRYEAPRGEAERLLAGIWQELLRVERVGRQDNFFELGGHSLLIVQMMERLRRVGLFANVRSIYESQTLAALAQTLTRSGGDELEVPPNRIPVACGNITPEMLPLIDLEVQQIRRIAEQVPGGMANIQDIYPLAPLQDGMLFHHLLDEQGGDTYVVAMLLSAYSQERLREFIAALQVLIDRHDMLRTSVMWEELPRAVQVVHRQTLLPVEEFELEATRDPIEQLQERMRPERQRMDIRRAPLMRLQVAADPRSQHWHAILQVHHLVGDHESLDTMLAEVIACLSGNAGELPEPQPYRNHVAQALLHARTHDAETFFRGKLAGIDGPTTPFGLMNVHANGSSVACVQQTVEAALSQRIRAQARHLGVSSATLFHVVWAMVVAHTSGRDDVVFGTVLLGRLQGSAGGRRTLGLFMNTLPLRLQLQGASAKDLVLQTQRELVDLLAHEQASLAVAQRCSGLSGATPLFNSLLNYRWGTIDFQSEFASVGMERREIRSHSNYPIMLSVLDKDGGFLLDMQTDRVIDPQRMVGYVTTAMESLLEALDRAPQRRALSLTTIPKDELHLIVERFNAMQANFPNRLVHELFEEQAERTPTALAVVHEQDSLSYFELNRRANQLARHLRQAGVAPDRLVALCAERSVEVFIAILAIMKAGGAYLPLDPAYPSERLHYMLNDARPILLLTQQRLQARVAEAGLPLFCLDADWERVAGHSGADLQSKRRAPAGKELAYVIYTSGSTGRPKGVMIEHRSVVNLWQGLENVYSSAGELPRRIGLNASLNFDASVQQLVHLLSGRTIVLLPEEVRRDIPALMKMVEEQAIDGIDCTPSQLKLWVAGGLLESDSCPLRMVLIGGEAIDTLLWDQMQRSHIDFFNVYGPTECTVDCTVAHVNRSAGGPQIGQPMSNRRLYVLDSRGDIAPLGVAGEIYVGGTGNGRGYLNQPRLTAERFIADPFGGDEQARLYMTGDIGRWRPDGTLECLGRNDGQVKIRGFRIELGEIEAQLARHERVRDAAVIVREDIPDEQRLVAYITPRGTDIPSTKELREYLRDVLPDHMIPSAIVSLEALPVTVNGKLDRRALPAPESGAYVARQYEEPKGELERQLAEIWQDLLGVGRIGRQDNFFELGGHSLLMMQLVAKVAMRLAIKLRVATVLENPEFQQFARAVSEVMPHNVAATPARQVNKKIIVL